MREKEQEITQTTKILAQIEALLFSAPGFTNIKQISDSLNLSVTDVKKYLSELSDHYQKQHGIRLQQKKDDYQLVTAPEYSELIETFLGLEVYSRLTQASLEVLAIIAYNQPTTRPDIDMIRGVNSDGVIRGLLAKGLIEEIGRADAVGRPILYGVTFDFLQYFGLESLDQLPGINIDLILKDNLHNNSNQRILKD